MSRLEFILLDEDQKHSELKVRDSWAKSGLRRMMTRAKGKQPKPLGTQNAKDLWLADVEPRLLTVLRSYKESAGLKNISHCLRAVEQTLGNHAAHDGRGYLDFLPGFFDQEPLKTASHDFD